MAEPPHITYRMNPAYRRKVRLYQRSLLAPWGAFVLRLANAMIVRVPPSRLELSQVALRIQEDMPHGCQRGNCYGARIMLEASARSIRDDEYTDVVRRLCEFHERFIVRLDAIDQAQFEAWHADMDARMSRCLAAPHTFRGKSGAPR